MVEEKINGSMIITYRGRTLKFKEITARPEKIEPKNKHEFKLKKVFMPPKDHPWRRFKIRNYPQNYTYSQKEKSNKKEKELLLVH